MWFTKAPTLLETVQHIREEQHRDMLLAEDQLLRATHKHTLACARLKMLDAQIASLKSTTEISNVNGTERQGVIPSEHAGYVFNPALASV